MLAKSDACRYNTVSAQCTLSYMEGDVLNKSIPKIGSAIVAASVFLFALCMLVDYPFGSYLVCMFLPIGYIMMTAGFQNECSDERRVSANIGLVFSAIYAVLIFLVYFAQTTSVRQETLTEQAIRLLDYQRGGLLFNYDLLGYGMMSISTFFVGLSIQADGAADQWLKYLLMIHGVFFIGCFIMPMTGVFTNMASGESGKGGTIALLIWCIYFLPIGVLAYKHFSRKA